VQSASPQLEQRVHFLGPIDGFMAVVAGARREDDPIAGHFSKMTLCNTQQFGCLSMIDETVLPSHGPFQCANSYRVVKKGHSHE